MACSILMLPSIGGVFGFRMSRRPSDRDAPHRFRPQSPRSSGRSILRMSSTSPAGGQYSSGKIMASILSILAINAIILGTLEVQTKSVPGFGRTACSWRAWFGGHSHL